MKNHVPGRTYSICPTTGVVVQMNKTKTKSDVRKHITHSKEKSK